MPAEVARVEAALKRAPLGWEDAPVVVFIAALSLVLNTFFQPQSISNSFIFMGIDSNLESDGNRDSSPMHTQHRTTNARRLGATISISAFVSDCSCRSGYDINLDADHVSTIVPKSVRSA